MAIAGSAAVLAASGCGGDAQTDGEVELVLETFGTFGYDAVIEEFEQETGHTVDHRVYGEQPDFAEALEQNIAAGSGAGDVVALEEAHIVGMLEQADAFVDLNDHGAGDMEGQFLDWKWELGQTTDGQLVGLGTDVGSLAICYRWDLFEEAGLPTDRDEVSELWPEWDDYLAVGQEFRDADTDESFVADIGEVYTAITRQSGGDIYFAEADDELIVADNPVVRDAFDFSVELVEEDLSAGLDTFSDDWTAAIQAGTFATMPCPSWMLGQIEDSAGGDGEGLWDVADVPGDGGNWGGSWLAVPEQSENPEAAAELAMFLSGPEGQLNAWEEASNLPSNLEVLESDEVQGYVREYFNDAPTGEIFGSIAADLQPYYMGPDHVAVHDSATNPIDELQRNGLSSDEAWNQLIDEAERAAR